MSAPRILILILALALPVLAAPPARAVLIHRYSFNNPAGDASGAVLTDSVGAADGLVQGAGAVFTGTSLDLPGGDSNTQAYGDLPSNLISPLTAVTVEGWVTIDAGGPGWARIFDFGSTEPGGAAGEITGPGNTNGGGTAGLDYFFLSAARGADYNVQRVEVRNEDPAGGGIFTFDSGVATTFGQRFHFAVTWQDTGVGTSEVNYWRDGVQLTTGAVANSNLADLNDVNNWLGRSTWLNDGNTDMTIDEFRIYDSALTGTEVSASIAAGPDAVISNDDTDRDGIPDDYEDLYAFLDKANPDDAALDEDMDGLTNLEEYNVRTRPDVADTDGDGLLDGAEVDNHGTSPLLADSDRDGLSDGDEINIHRTLPNDPDTDDDGLPDGYETQFAFLDPNLPGDSANDEEPDDLTNLGEFQAGTDPLDPDSDDDGLTDGAEVNVHGTSPLVFDSDGDGLGDGIEVNTTNTLPNNPDTDGDGINDGPEVAAGLDPLSADPTTPGVLHRYSFNDPAGPASPGAIVTDLIGGADGTIVGANGLWTGSALTLPGGAGADADAAYVDLPNGILSAHDHVTFEAWYRLHSAQAWGRIWDFGSTAGGEILTGMTGSTEGQDYFLFAPNRGTDINTQRFTVRNLDPLAPAGGMGPVDGDEEAFDTNLATALNQDYHVAGVWTSDPVGGGQLVLYRDGVYQGGRTTSFAPRDISDVNNWLGRSNWTGDSYLNGSLDEFRIYEGAMNQAAAAASFAAGPDAPIGVGNFRITEIIYDRANDQFTLTWTSQPNRLYSLFWDTDLGAFTRDIDDGIASGGETTTAGPFANPSPGAPKIYFRAVENGR